LRRQKWTPDSATYINYWFRHLWVPSWPLFQSVLITAAVFSLDPLQIVAHTWPGTIGAILGGLLVAYPLVLLKLKCPDTSIKGAASTLLKSIWPLILLATLFIGAKLHPEPPTPREPMLASLIIVILTFLAAHKPNARMIKGALKLATRPTIHLVLFESLLFKNLIILGSASQTVTKLVSLNIIPLSILVIIIPFILGLAAGGENFFASTAMPLLAAYISAQGVINWELLSLAYIGGYLGVMASPVHLCLVLTAEYYKASIGRVLLYTFLTIIASLLISIPIIIALY
jgi:integral membrane protein (TIGR00529 family)